MIRILEKWHNGQRDMQPCIVNERNSVVGVGYFVFTLFFLSFFSEVEIKKDFV